MMTPEQRLDRAERIVVMLAKAGYRARREWRFQSRQQYERARQQDERARQHDERSRDQDEKINILIHTQMETTELVKGLAAGQARVDKEMAELAQSHRLTEQALQAFINSLHKGQNGES